MINALQIGYDSISYAGYEDIPLFVYLTKAVNDHRCKHPVETVHIAAYKEEESMDRQEGWIMADGSCRPWYGIVWHWKAGDINTYRRR